MISPNYLPKEKRWKFRYTYYDEAGIRSSDTLVCPV